MKENPRRAAGWSVVASRQTGLPEAPRPRAERSGQRNTLAGEWEVMIPLPNIPLPTRWPVRLGSTAEGQAGKAKGIGPETQAGKTSPVSAAGLPREPQAFTGRVQPRMERTFGAITLSHKPRSLRASVLSDPLVIRHTARRHHKPKLHASGNSTKLRKASLPSLRTQGSAAHRPQMSRRSHPENRTD